MGTITLSDKQQRRAEILGRLAVGTLDRVLIGEGVRKRSRSRGRRVYCRRERSGREGQMLLIDASPHDWLEGRGPRMCLIAAIDDATSCLLHLRFWPTECLLGYLS